jgi:hypothetical protein
MPVTFLQFGRVRLALLGCLMVGLLGSTTGCSKPKSTDMAEVSGKVLFGGKPLTGGRIIFISTSGQAFTGDGNIDENGNYKVQAPIGEVKVGVDNRMLAPPSGRGGAPPASKPGLKRPGSEEAKPMKGTYVKIPEKYYSPEESGLKFTIKKGAQQLDIPLSP